MISLNKELSRELQLVTEKKKQIVDSINYAQRLQMAMMPGLEEINSFVKDHFVLNMPKSIVSGDFYLVDRFATNGYNRLTAIALADCTGHGVPGAMMSTLSCGMLKNAFADKSISTAGEVLDHISDKISNVFKMDSSMKRMSDGMDISLCILDSESKILQYSGANQKGIVLRKDKTIIELMPNKQHIGYNENNIPFTTHMMQLQQGDTIYLFSDGFKDQFGGESGKKIQYKNFLAKIIEISNQELSEQKILLENFLNHWKKGISQTDDILVLGVSV